VLLLNEATAKLPDTIVIAQFSEASLETLDPYTVMVWPKQVEDFEKMMTNEFTGIGIEIDRTDDRIRVITPIAGSPAARSGIQSGDEIIAVDGEPIDADSLQDAIERLRGHAGSKVLVTVLRDDQAIDYEMRRQIIRVASVHKEFLSPAYGYVRINQFSDNTARELSKAVDELQDANGGMLEGLVLDLRNNPGGVLDAAVEVSDLFLDSGVIVTADGRTVDARFTRSAHRGDILDGAEMVVLVNKGSASASEIVAGALQDHARAVIVGTSTFGKGLVQTVLPLSQGRAIKLTTSRYYTPSGDSIHEIGITPDILVEDTPGFPDLSLAGVLDREADQQLAEAIGYLQSGPVMHSNAQ